ncbi:hypothetical protein ANN_07032 [Periplaneta americana]|uniref:Mutator-like transposase domain-containing protein n=1 Tax=Periplaneta americana TaxID=6978 RepID=A0ABQ8TH17_PERAM|nr:hypothetical protein ANN_07032 [Periplaneta americana]
MLCDGDAKTYIKLNSVKPYGKNVEIEKEECINHMGKRLGTALRGAVDKWKVLGVTLGGRGDGAITKHVITKLQKYYDKSIRSNIGNIHNMKSAIYATLHHSISTDSKPQHFLCPPGSNSWCFYKRAEADCKPPPPHKKRVGTPIRECYLAKILPIYQRLASDSLLKRCQMGKTQKCERKSSFNDMEAVPKGNFCFKTTGRICSVPSC